MAAEDAKVRLRRRTAPAPAAAGPVRRSAVSPDEVVRQNERRSGVLLLDEEAAVRRADVDLGASLIPQIRAILDKQEQAAVGGSLRAPSSV